MNALISPQQNSLVVQVIDTPFEVAAPLYWVDCPDNIEAGQFTYEDGNFVPYTPPPPTAEQNKQRAVMFLNETDWTTIADVGNPQMSNPYLANQAAFIAWRSQIRAIATDPAEGYYEVFGQKPTEQWVTV